MDPKKDVQERELSLIREYETRLLALEEDNAARDLSTSTATSGAITRLSTIMRQVLRSLGGEDGEDASEEQAAASLEREIERACRGVERARRGSRRLLPS